MPRAVIRMEFLISVPIDKQDYDELQHKDPDRELTESLASQAFDYLIANDPPYPPDYYYVADTYAE